MLNKVFAYSLGFLIIYALEHKKFKVNDLVFPYTLSFLAVLGVIQMLIDKAGG